ncbi:MAG: hypothetical protein ACI8PZ_002738 [Myxococcota bacterium]|jgi:hypothetical protein
MSDSPVQSTTPADHTVVALSIEAALLPGWFEAVKGVAAKFVRRMAVVEKPDEWLVHCELPAVKAEAFHAALQEAWTVYNAD